MRTFFKYLSFLAILIIVGCNSPQEEKEVKVVVEEIKSQLLLVSKDDAKERVRNWIHSLDSNIVIKVCYGLSMDSLDYYLNISDGIIIGGGEDVNPELYGKPQYEEVCGKPDDYRDSLEFRMIHYASDNKIPIMGICRGQQIMNVAHGGTLIPDIPTYVKNNSEHRSNKENGRAHAILPVEGTWLTEHFKQDSFWVNSLHHQAIDQLAKDFEVAAYAPDSVIEAVYIKDKTIHPFTMAVQFHPELLRDSLSNKFGMLLLDAITTK